jgi:hypothetical protein
MKNGIFTAIVDSSLQLEVAAEALRKAIVETVIYNTSVKQRVDENYYFTMKMQAEGFVKAKTITMFVGVTKEEFSFFGKELKNLQKLYSKLIDFDAYYEDNDEYISETGVRFTGFCWKYIYNGKTTKCGLYCPAVETATDTADEEEFEDALKEANEAYNLEGEYCNWEA